MIAPREGKPQFTWAGTPYTFNRLPQGCRHSPTTAHRALAALPDTVTVPPGIGIYQCRGDILLGGDNGEQLGLAAQTGWNSLTKAELDVPSSKRQGLREEMKF